jgi:hypothetical protein
MVMLFEIFFFYTLKLLFLYFLLDCSIFVEKDWTKISSSVLPVISVDDCSTKCLENETRSIHD